MKKIDISSYIYNKIYSPIIRRLIKKTNITILSRQFNNNNLDEIFSDFIIIRDRNK